MKAKVVIGANYGDEGKGLVSGCLARDAHLNNKVLTVLYNGTNQRAHTFENKVYRMTGAGADYSDTFYHRMFVVDPILLWISKTIVTIDPRCRLILPCDVLHGQAREKLVKHGSCGFGLFSAVKRSKTKPYYLQDWQRENKYKYLQNVDSFYDYIQNEIHNLANFIRAINWVCENCIIKTFEEVVAENNYDEVIFEGGQGLLLDQENLGDFPHLTPSSTGAFNIHEDIEKLHIPLDLFYVSRSYMTRHGAGPMEAECDKIDINADIVDLTNQPNDWQGSLRFGRIDTDNLFRRIEGDAARFNCEKSINIVFTQLNYTDGLIETIDGRSGIIQPAFVNQIWTSDKKDDMKLI